MRREVNETVYDMVGVDLILASVAENITKPFQKMNTLVNNERQVPKSILITGKSGSGKTALASAIVNELRRGASNKQADIHYTTRKVSFIQWDMNEVLYSNTRTQANQYPFQVTILTFNGDKEVRKIANMRNPSDYLVSLFDYAKTNPHGLTVIYLEKFERLCPSDDTMQQITTRASYPTVNNNKLVYKQQLLNATRGKVLVIATTRETTATLDAEVYNGFDYAFHLPKMDIPRSILMISNFLAQMDAVASEDVLKYAANPRHFCAFRAKPVVAQSVAEAKDRTARNGRATQPVVVCQIDYETALREVDNRRRARAAPAMWEDYDALNFQRPRLQPEPDEDVAPEPLFGGHVPVVAAGAAVPMNAADLGALLGRIQEVELDLNRRFGVALNIVADREGNNDSDSDEDEGNVERNNEQMAWMRADAEEEDYEEPENADEGDEANEEPEEANDNDEEPAVDADEEDEEAVDTDEEPVDADEGDEALVDGDDGDDEPMNEGDEEDSENGDANDSDSESE